MTITLDDIDFDIIDAKGNVVTDQYGIWIGSWFNGEMPDEWESVQAADEWLRAHSKGPDTLGAYPAWHIQAEGGA